MFHTILFIATFMAILVSSPAQSHDGFKGCHFDSAGEHHCHRSSGEEDDSLAVLSIIAGVSLLAILIVLEFLEDIDESGDSNFLTKQNNLSKKVFNNSVKTTVDTEEEEAWIRFTTDF